MPRRKIVILILLSLIFSLITVTLVIWFALKQKEPALGGDFTLIHRGQEWIFSKNAKKLNIVYVGYVKCPDVCPMTLSFAAQTFKKLTENEQQDVQLIFISVDSEHDTAVSVADYAVQFFPHFIGLTGQPQKIQLAVKAIGANFMIEKDSNSYLGYSISHSDRVFLLNKRSEVIDSVPHLRSDQTLLEKIREYL